MLFALTKDREPYIIDDCRQAHITQKYCTEAVANWLAVQLSLAKVKDSNRIRQC